MYVALREELVDIVQVHSRAILLQLVDHNKNWKKTKIWNESNYSKKNSDQMYKNKDGLLQICLQVLKWGQGR